VALRVPAARAGSLALHVAPQLIPVGLDVTLPEPVPALATLRVKLVTGAGVKVATTDRSALSVTRQAPVPLHAPLQPENIDAVAGVALRVMTLPSAKVALHVGPQLIPPGEEGIVPPPTPALLTVSLWVTGVRGKLAATACAGLIVPWQAPVPLHAPLQPEKVDPEAAVAVSVTTVDAA